MPPPPKQTTLFTLPSRVDCQFSYPTQRNGSVDSLPPAVQDGFTVDEVMEFSQLLCSPKKTPPSHYQCHICFNTGHYISDCPMRFNSNHDELTPYQGRKKCYGEFICTICKRRWTSQNSVANEAQSCLKCGIAVFPHKQVSLYRLSLTQSLFSCQSIKQLHSD
jgi:hypothetical protein